MDHVKKIASPSPGDVILHDFLGGDASLVARKELADKIGIDTLQLERLLCGDMLVTQDIAERLSVSLGTSVELWINLQLAKLRDEFEDMKDNDVTRFNDMLFLMMDSVPDLGVPWLHLEHDNRWFLEATTDNVFPIRPSIAYSMWVHNFLRVAVGLYRKCELEPHWLWYTGLADAGIFKARVRIEHHNEICACMSVAVFLCDHIEGIMRAMRES